jgi:hypothetical protein
MPSLAQEQLRSLLPNHDTVAGLIDNLCMKPNLGKQAACSFAPDTMFPEKLDECHETNNAGLIATLDLV